MALSLVWLISLSINRLIPFIVRTVPVKIFSSISIQDIVSGSLGIDFILFIFFTIGLHLLLGAAIWIIVTVIARQHNLNDKSYLAIGLFLWLAVIFWLNLNNGLSFSRSSSNYLVKAIVGLDYSQIGFLALSILLCGVLLYSAILLLKMLFAKHQRLLIIGGSTSFLLLVGWVPMGEINTASYTGDRPNIIMIGVDSLRPDYMGKREGNDSLTPAMDAFIHDSVQFTQAVTPLARTFPSWISILSGQYPKTSGARYNLIKPSRLNTAGLLTWRLKEQGYQTMVAMDERRFANIDSSYGFDFEIGPKMGAGDFVLGSVNDTPLTNMFLDTKIGKFLFPYNHLNRGISNLYRPKQFVNQIDKTVKNNLSDQPLFLVAHFCLPHWPFTWSKKQEPFDTALTVEEQRSLEYSYALAESDRQFSSLMANLKAEGLLENSIVVLLSDHGESHGETMEPYQQYGTNENNVVDWLVTRQEWGHGTNILRDEQNDVLFAVRRFGEQPTQPKVVEERVSLIDITPTILDVLGLEGNEQELDGISLAQVIMGEYEEPLPSRPFFLESGFSIEAILSVNPKLAELMIQGMQHYSINRDNGRMEVRDQSHNKILAGKQRAVLLDDWMLLAIQGRETDAPHFMALFDKKNKRWTSDLSSVLENNEHAAEMLKYLTDFYGEEITYLPTQTSSG